MAQKKKGKGVDAWKAKHWYKIKAPKLFEEKELGESMSGEPKQMLGRGVKITLREITGNIPHQSVQLDLRVSDVKGESVETVPVGYELNRGYLQRQTRRMRSMINTITDATTSDGYTLRIKSLSFGHGKMRIAQQKEVRRITDSFIRDLAAKATFEKLFTEVAYGKASAEVYKLVRKIYPVAKTEITKLTLLAAPGAN